MASTYPATLDTFATNKTNSTAMTTDHATHHNDLADAINKVEAELGTDPRGTYATVKARLNDLANKTAANTFQGTITMQAGIGLGIAFSDNYASFTERTDPSAPGADIGRMYVRDNGAGKSQLVIRFSSGAIQVIATQP